VAKGLRYTEEQFREHAAKRARFQRGSEVIDTAHMVEPASASKYNNVKSGGYASKREARVAEQLRERERRGEIRDLKEQVWFLLVPKAIGPDGKVTERACSYVADWTWIDGDGRLHVGDAKGFRTDVYKIKKKLLLFVHGHVIEEL